MSATPRSSSATYSEAARVRRIAVGVDGYGEDRDAAVMGATIARVLLGRTGEALLNDAGCSVLAAPRGDR